jgi:hypothetical protein
MNKRREQRERRGEGERRDSQGNERARGVNNEEEVNGIYYILYDIIYLRCKYRKGKGQNNAVMHICM